MPIERVARPDADELGRRIAGRRPAVFLDYDGVLTAIVDRPEDARVTAGMREVGRGLAQRCSAYVITGRVVQDLMGLQDLVVAGRVKDAVDSPLADFSDELKVTPGKMVFELQPRLDWDKGKGVLYLLEALHLKRPEVVPLYLGDDITDEDAFRVLASRGIGIFVGRCDDPALAGRRTAASFVLDSTKEVQTFLDRLAR